MEAEVERKKFIEKIHEACVKKELSNYEEMEYAEILKEDYNMSTKEVMNVLNYKEATFYRRYNSYKYSQTLKKEEKRKYVDMLNNNPMLAYGLVAPINTKKTKKKHKNNTDTQTQNFVKDLYNTNKEINYDYEVLQDEIDTCFNYFIEGLDRALQNYNKVANTNKNELIELLKKKELIIRKIRERL